MTIMETTPSEPIGIKPTEMDISFRSKGLYKTVFQATTIRGHMWISENMDHASDFTVTIDREFEEELKEKMRKDGLTV